MVSILKTDGTSTLTGNDIIPQEDLAPLTNTIQRIEEIQKERWLNAWKAEEKAI